MENLVYVLMSMVLVTTETTIGDITQAMMMDMTNRIMTDPHSFVVTV